MGCRTTVGHHHAAPGGSNRRQIEIEMGQKTTLHDWRGDHGWNIPLAAGMGGRSGRIIRDSPRYGMHAASCRPQRDDGTNFVQKRSLTIVLAVFSIYAVDFAINAGKPTMFTLGFNLLSEIPVQSSSRSLLVDTLPISRQQLGSAWGECCCFLDHYPGIEILKPAG